MDWHEGLDHSKQYLDGDQIAALVGCDPGDVDAYEKRQRDPNTAVQERFNALGEGIDKQAGAGADPDQIREFWTGGEPATMLKTQRFDELETLVDRRLQTFARGGQESQR